MLDILRFISFKKIIHTHINFESPISFPFLSVFLFNFSLRKLRFALFRFSDFVDLFVSNSRGKMFCVVFGLTDRTLPSSFYGSKLFLPSSAQVSPVQGGLHLHE